jgi:hypothetical protein
LRCGSLYFVWWDCGSEGVEVWLRVVCLVGLRESEGVEVWLPVFCLVGLRESEGVEVWLRVDDAVGG